MENFIQRVIVNPFDRFIENVIHFLPHLFSSILILAAGFLVAWLVKILLHKAFTFFSLDKFMERSGIVELLKKSGLGDTFSGLLARLISYIILFIFIIVSLIALRISPVEKLLESLFLYLPNIFAALLILFVGFLLGNFFSTATLIACVNAGLRISSLAAKIVKFLVILLTLTMVMEQLGIGRETIKIAFAIILGGFVLAIALAFGLGGRDSAKDYIEKKLKGENDRDEIKHI